MKTNPVTLGTWTQSLRASLRSKLFSASPNALLTDSSLVTCHSSLLHNPMKTKTLTTRSSLATQPARPCAGHSSLAFLAFAAFALLSSSAFAQVDVTATGGVNASYATLGAAFTAINAGTHTGTINIGISASTVEGAVVATLNASGTGSASYGSVTIRPTGGAPRTIVGTPAAGSPMIDLNGADNVTIDGLNTGGNSLIIQNTTVSTTAGTSTIRLINDATGNLIQNATINGAATGASTGTILFSTTTGATGNDNNFVTACNIGPVGATFPTNAIFSSGTTTTQATRNSGCQVTNCNIFDFYNAAGGITASGINLAGSTDWTITGNSFYQTASRAQVAGGGYIVIGVSDTSGVNFVISNNFIGGSAASAGGTAWTETGATTHTFIGIRMSVGSATPSSLQNNTIQNINNTTSTTSTVNAGISAVTGAMNIGTTTGNTIGAATGTGSITWTSAGANQFAGILAGTGTPNGINISNNTLGSWTVGGTAVTTLYGIRFQGAATAAGYTVSNNTIGSTTTANSITNNSNGVFVGISGTQTLFPATVSNNTIQNLQCTSTGASASLRGIELTGSINGQTISANTIANFSTTSTNTSSSSGTAIIAITLTGSATSGNTITTNTIRDLASTTAGATAVYNQGIVITSTPGTTISRNFIYNLTTASTSTTSSIVGIQLFNSSATENIYNNMIRLGTGVGNNPIIRGVYDNSASSSPTNIYFNSIFIDGTQGANVVNTSCINKVVASTMDVKDNILWNNRASTGAPGSNAGRHYAINTTSGNPTSNYNDLYTPNNGGTIGFSTSDRITLANWQSGTSQDANSFNTDPQFIDATNATTPNLHIHPTNTTVIEGNGILVSPPTDDFDGQTRASFTPVDIGADAGNFAGIDLSPPVITYTPLGNTTSTANRTLASTITDVTGVPTSGVGLPVIYYRKGASGTFASTQASFAGGNSYNFTIDYANVTGGSVVVGDTIQYYVVAQDTAATPNIIANPSAGAGSYTANPPAAGTPPTTPNSYTIQAAISGTFTVGTGGNYASLTAAVADLNSKVITGPVVFNLIENTTNGLDAAETYPITINANSGSSASNTVTIKPNTGQTITMTAPLAGAASAVFILNGADWIIIDGSNNGTSSRDLTITNLNTSTSSALVWMQTTAGADAATNNTVKNVNLVGNSNTTTLFGVGSGSTTISISSTGTGNNNNTFQNNNISKTQYGIYSGGASAANKNTGTVISGNLINAVSPNNVAIGGILVNFESGISITQNTIAHINSATTPAFGITLGTRPSNTFTTFTGSECVGATVSQNFIDDIVRTGDGTSFGIGVATTTTVGAAANTLTNNFVSGVRTTVATPSDFGAGLLLGGGATGSTKAYFNSVSMTGVGSNSSPTFAIVVGGSNPVVDLQDNIFYNTQTTTTGKTYAIGLAYASPYTNLTSDYNDFVSTGTTAAFAVTGGLAGTDRTSLAAWRTETGKDANSKNVDPVFTSVSDLHLQGTTTLGAMGITIAGITIDIDGQTRANPPFIGADEIPVSPGTLQFSSATYSVTEQAITATITVTRANGTQGAASVMYATSDGSAMGGVACGGTTDYITTSGTLNWANGDSANKTFTVTVCNDGVSEPSETVNLALSNATGATLGSPNTATLTIINSDAFNGSYTIGAGGSYPSLTGVNGALTALNNGYLTGPVVFNLIENSTSIEAVETYPITINAIAGSSAANTLTIKPATGATVSITGSVASGPIFKLNGASNVIIDGSNSGGTDRSLTITNTNATSPSVIAFTSIGTTPFTNTTLKNCVIVNGANTSSAVVISDGATLGNAGFFSNVTIQNNSVQKAFIGVYANGGTTPQNGSNLVYTQNDLSTSGANAIRFTGLYMQGVNGATVTQNTIGNFSGTESEDDQGIWLATGTINATVDSNTIKTLKYTGTGGYGCHGIAVSTGATGANIQVSNNMLYDLSGDGFDYTGSFFADNPFAIYAFSTQTGVKIYFNSINLTGNTLNQTNALSAGIVLGTGTTADVRDNAVVNNLGLLSATGYGSTGIWLQTASSQLAVADYNDYFVNPTGSGVKAIGKISTTTTSTTLFAWQGATSQEGHSLSVNPPYVSATNLHLQTSPISPLSAAGVTIAGITTDIDGNTRQSPPDIGADEIITYTLTYTAGANGSVTGTSPQTVVSGGSGTAVTAVPNACYHFVNWSDGSTQNPRTDTNVMMDISVTANFAINTYTLTYTAGANGSVSGMSPQTVNCGDSGSAVLAIPNACYHFVQWSDGSTQNPRTDTNVMMDITVQAQFAINTYTLTYTADPNGTIMGTTPQMVNCGGDGTAVTAVPNACYHFVMWSDGSTQNPRTDMNVMADITVQAQFAITTYTLTYTAGANGSVTGMSPQMVNCGGSGSAVTAVPNSCYHFVNWSDGSTQNPRTDTNVMMDINVTANFAITTYTLTYTAGANGSISGSSPQTVNCGGNGTAVTAVPNTCYHFVNWSDGSTQNPRSDVNVMMDISVTANFAINTNTVTYDGNGNTGGSPPVDPNSPYNCGATVTVLGPGTLTRTGYTFTGWNTAANGSGTAYNQGSMFTINADTILYAQWSLVPTCPRVALANDNSTSGNARAPQLRNRFERGVYLIKASELAAAGFSAGNVMTSIGFNYQTGQGLSGSAPLIIYMQNTTDTTNTKSTTWATAISGMSTVHNATTTLPAAAGPFDISFSGGTPSSFTYTGGGIYVAFDFGQYTGTLSTTTVVWCNSTGLVNGLLSAQSNTSAPTTTLASSFRPETRFNGQILMNDAAVTAIYSLGEIPYCIVPAQTIKAVITNNGSNTLTNLPVTLNITGADTFTDTQTIASLAGCGGQAVVTFAPYTPSALGSDTIAVSVPADDNNTNNSQSKPLNNTQLSYTYKIPGSTASGGVGVTGATASLVAKMTTTAANAVTAVKLEFAAISATTYKVAIYGDSGSGTPSTTPLYLDAANRTVTVAGPVTITLPSPVVVGPGNFYVGIQQTNNTNANLSFDNETPIRSGAFFLAIPIGSAWFDEAPGNNFKLNIGAVMQTGCPGYTVTYDGNGNTGGTAPVDPNSPYNYNATVTVLGQGTLVRTGYTFTGWNTAANGSGTSYSPGAMFNITVNTTLYAQWISSNADLSNLTVSAGTLVPAFNSNTTSYTDTVPNTTSMMTVTPFAADANSTIKVNGISVPSGMPSQNITLNEGNNVISIVVTAQDSITTKTYTVTVHRTPGVVNGNDSGAGSLRQALANSQDGDVITFGAFLAGTPEHPAPDVPLSTVTLTSGELVVSTSITIMGSGADTLTVTRDGMAANFRIFHVLPGKTVTISGMTISNGHDATAGGGGIYNDHSVLTVSGCAVTSNSADFVGGGIYNDGSFNGSATLTVTSSTLNGNSAPGSNGGGIFNDAFNTGSATCSVNNSTFSGNTGSGIGTQTSDGVTTTAVANSTFANNNGGSIRSLDGGTLDIGNTILKAGTGANIAGFTVTTSHGYNLSTDTGGGSLTALGDQINTDPMLGPLKNNGGTTLTHAPLIGSAAIDQGKRDAIPALATNVDQRGSGRPVNDTAIPNAAGGDGSDIGAVEVQQFVHPTAGDSRKTHGATDFNVPLSLVNFAASPLGIECRTGGATGDFTVIFTFAGNVSFTGAGVTSGTGSVMSSSGSGTNQATVNLTGVTNAQRITIALFDANDGMNISDVGFRMGVLLGDVTGNAQVDSSDFLAIKMEVGHAVSGANFRTDVNTNGETNSSDVTMAKSKSGTGLP